MNKINNNNNSKSEKQIEMLNDIGMTIVEKLSRNNLSDYEFVFNNKGFKVFKDEILIIDNEIKKNSNIYHPFLMSDESKEVEFDLNKVENIFCEESLIKQKNNEIILIFSPHQDDEVLGCGAFIHKIRDLNFKVIYMTSGKGGGNSLVRKQEAINGLKLLTGKENISEFWDMPFYNKEDRKTSLDDFIYFDDKFSKFENISNLFVCSDLIDPNKTHFRCFNILLKYVKLKYENFDISFKEKLNLIENKMESINNLKLISKESILSTKYPFNLFLYFSVWYNPFLSEITHYSSYNKEEYALKVKAMLEHISQLKNNHMGIDPTPFYVRATVRDENYYLKFKEFIHDKNIDDSYCEVFHKVFSKSFNVIM